MLATLLTFTDMAQSSTVLPPAEKEQVAQALEEDAEVMTNTALDQQLVDQPEEIQDEIIRINTEARPSHFRSPFSSRSSPGSSVSSTRFA